MNISPFLVLGTLSLVAVGVTASLVLVDSAESPTVVARRVERAAPGVGGDDALEPSLSEALQDSVNAESGRDPVDWSREARESMDHYSLAQRMAGAALAGDTRADYVLGQVLLECEVYKRILVPYTVGTVEQRIDYHLANSTLRRPETERARIRREALRCQRLFSENPFEGYDLPDDAHDFRYWSDRAVENGDPLATMQRVFRDAIARRESGDPEQERAFRDGLRNTVRDTAFSGDAAALFVVGGMLSHPSFVEDPAIGYAWMVAACESGHDCSNSNPDFGLGCAERGTCEAGRTWLDTLQRDLGPAKYASIYASAQDIQYKLRTNDWDGLQQYVKLKE